MTATVVSSRSAHEAALSAATSSNPDPNAGLPHSPRLLKQLAVNPAPMTTAAPGPQGVDVSFYQDPIDWSQVAADPAGYKFAWVKATEGDYYSNSSFKTDIAGAAEYGLYPAAYHFAIPNVTTGTQQADYLLATAAGSVNGATPQIGLDIEYDPNVKSDHTNSCYGMTASQLVSWITSFSNEIRRKAGQSPVFYTTADWWNYCTGDSKAFPGYQLWIASPTTGSPTLPAAREHLDAGSTPARGPWLAYLGPLTSTTSTPAPARCPARDRRRARSALPCGCRCTPSSVPPRSARRVCRQVFHSTQPPA